MSIRWSPKAILSSLDEEGSERGCERGRGRGSEGDRAGGGGSGCPVQDDVVSLMKGGGDGMDWGNEVEIEVEIEVEEGRAAD